MVVGINVVGYFSTCQKCVQKILQENRVIVMITVITTSLNCI